MRDAIRLLQADGHFDYLPFPVSITMAGSTTMPMKIHSSIPISPSL
jgi:hypothetical protein